MTRLEKVIFRVLERVCLPEGRFRFTYSCSQSNTYDPPTPRIALSVRPFVRPTLKNPASEIHASGSRIMDTSIIHTCITHACIRIKEHRYMHHTYLHQGQGSRIIDTCNIHMCIMHTCIRIKNHRHINHNQGH